MKIIMKLRNETFAFYLFFSNEFGSKAFGLICAAEKRRSQQVLFCKLRCQFLGYVECVYFT